MNGKTVMILVVYTAMIMAIAFVVHSMTSKSDKKSSDKDVLTVVDNGNTKSVTENNILNHLQLQKQVSQDMIRSDYMNDEFNGEDIQHIVSVFNLALGLHYLSLVTLEELSEIVESNVAQFIRESFESCNTYTYVKEGSAVEDND